jgi:hypothetical protein
MLATAVACGQLGPGPDQVVAISVAVSDSVEELDTLHPHGKGLNSQGDSIGATVLWATLDTALLKVVNETTGAMMARQASATPARIQARVGDLRSNPIPVRVLAAADTLFAVGRTVDTVTMSSTTPPDSLSDSLQVELADTITGTATPVPLGGRPVVYAITYPVASGPVTLVTTDTARTLALQANMTTSPAGLATVKVRLLAGPRPDSVVVRATARRAVRTSVPGVATFVVRFLP